MHKLTKVELTVELFAVDNVEPVRNISHHVRDLKIEPLMMMIYIHVWIQYQVIFILTNLQHNSGLPHEILLLTAYVKSLINPIALTLNLANSEDCGEMPYHAIFHQDLHCLLRQKCSSEKGIQNMEIKTCDHSIYTMDHSKFIISNQKEEFIRT